MTSTAAKANIILPSASFAERDGTVTNAERRVQRVRKAIEPIGSSKPDWQIISEIAKAMGHEKDFAFKDAESIFNEIAKAVPAYSGITYAKLEKPEAVQWPAAGGVFGTAILYTDKFGTKGRKGCVCRRRVQTCRKQLAGTTRLLHRSWPLGTLSSNTASIMREWPEPKVEINKEDAKALGILDGTFVKVTGKAGSITLTADVTKNIKKGVVGVPANVGAVVKLRIHRRELTMTKKGDMLYAWTNDAEIQKKAELGGAVTSLWKHALESKTIDAVLVISKGKDLYDAKPTLVTDPAPACKYGRLTPLRYAPPAKAHQEVL